jgi:hypothetical protein
MGRHTNDYLVKRGDTLSGLIMDKPPYVQPAVWRSAHTKLTLKATGILVYRVD